MWAALPKRPLGTFYKPARRKTKVKSCRAPPPPAAAWPAARACLVDSPLPLGLSLTPTTSPPGPLSLPATRACLAAALRPSPPCHPYPRLHPRATHTPQAAPSAVAQSDGICVDAFLAFNAALEDRDSFIAPGAVLE